MKNPLIIIHGSYKLKLLIWPRSYTLLYVGQKSDSVGLFDVIRVIDINLKWIGNGICFLYVCIVGVDLSL